MPSSFSDELEEWVQRILSEKPPVRKRHSVQLDRRERYWMAPEHPALMGGVAILLLKDVLCPKIYFGKSIRAPSSLQVADVIIFKPAHNGSEHGA